MATLRRLSSDRAPKRLSTAWGGGRPLSFLRKGGWDMRNQAVRTAEKRESLETAVVGILACGRSRALIARK
jgi:hypothetical protein